MTVTCDTICDSGQIVDRLPRSSISTHQLLKIGLVNSHLATLAVLHTLAVLQHALPWLPQQALNHPGGRVIVGRR